MIKRRKFGTSNNEIQRFFFFFVGETHEACNAYNFHFQKQEASESIEAYVIALWQLSKGCNFGEMQDWLTQDQIVVGFKDDTVRDKFLKDKRHRQSLGNYQATD